MAIHFNNVRAYVSCLVERLPFAVVGRKKYSELLELSDANIELGGAYAALYSAQDEVIAKEKKIESLERSAKFSTEMINQTLSRIREIWLENRIAEINDSYYVGGTKIYELYELRKQRAVFSLLMTNSDVLTEEEVRLIKQKTGYIESFNYLAF